MEELGRVVLLEAKIGSKKRKITVRVRPMIKQTEYLEESEKNSFEAKDAT